MDNYTVKQIAEMLNTQPETVRRWIRSGKLYAEKNSRKDGNIVSKSELDRFLRIMPKYLPSVAMGGAIFGGLLAASCVATSTDVMKSRTDKNTSKKDIISSLKYKIKMSEKNIQERQDIIDKLQREILIEQQNIAECKLMLLKTEKGD